jgi:hypothetical protein
MKILLNLILLFCLLLTTACEKFPFPWEKPGKEIEVKITDNEGNEVEEVQSGMVLRLTSNEFIAMNKNGMFRREGKILFNNTEAEILEAKENYFLTAVPVMHADRPLSLKIYIRFRDLLRPVCRICYILYRPRVTAIPWAGISGGEADGTFELPAEMALDAAGNLYVIDQRDVGGDVILKVLPDGSVSHFAGGGDVFGRLVGIGINSSTGRLYVSDATSQQVKWIALSGTGSPVVLAGSGTAGNTNGTGTRASFRFGSQNVSNFSTNEQGQGLALDAMGNIYVGEYWGTGAYNSQIRKITPTGVVSNVSGSRIEVADDPAVIALPAGVAVGNAGQIAYVGGASTFFQGITLVNASGTSPLAGKISYEGLNDGIGSEAEFSSPKAITYHSGFYYIADGTNGALRRVSPAGEVVTLAGVGHFDTPTFCGCPYVGPVESSYLMRGILNIGPSQQELAEAIRMDQVGGVAVQNSNLIYVSDYGYKIIWKITIE